MAQRTNYLTRYMPNEYGISVDGGMIPVGTVKTPKIDVSGMSADADALRLKAEQAKNSKMGETEVEAIQRKQSGMDAAIGESVSGITGAVGAVKKATGGAGKSSAGGSGGLDISSMDVDLSGAGGLGEDFSSVQSAAGGASKAAAGAGAATAVANVIAPVASQHYKNKGKEDSAGVISGAAQGAAMGMNFGPWGAAIGAVAGGILGGVKGKKDMVNRKKKEAEEKKWNAKMSKLESSSLTQADDLDAYKGLVQSAAQGGTIKFRSGGLVKYKEINVIKALKYIDNLIAEKAREEGKLEKAPIYKAGGKVGGCGCSVAKHKAGKSVECSCGGKIKKAEKGLKTDGIASGVKGLNKANKESKNSIARMYRKFKKSTETPVSKHQIGGKPVAPIPEETIEVYEGGENWGAYQDYITKESAYKNNAGKLARMEKLGYKPFKREASADYAKNYTLGRLYDDDENRFKSEYVQGFDIPKGELAGEMPMFLDKERGRNQTHMSVDTNRVWVPSVSKPAAMNYKVVDSPEQKAAKAEALRQEQLKGYQKNLGYRGRDGKMYGNKYHPSTSNAPLGDVYVDPSDPTMEDYYTKFPNERPKVKANPGASNAAGAITSNSKGGIMRVFKRGGKADLAKLNVIVDGPSHDDENNTGVKGDKGLPVVFEGKKVAEIESHELVINSASTKELEELVKKAKAGDKKAKTELAEKLAKELSQNTYDYSELLD